jgi:hypothetical protein
MIDYVVDRQTGRTTRQMLDAPKGAIFVWPNVDLHYPRQLAKRIDREDLLIRSLSWLRREKVLGQRFSAIVFDHQAWNLFKPENIEALDYLKFHSTAIL